MYLRKLLPLVILFAMFMAIHLQPLPWIKPEDLNRGLPASISIYTLNTTTSQWGAKLTGAFALIDFSDNNL